MNFFLKIFKFLPPEFAHSTSLNSLNLLYKLNLLNIFNKKIINKDELTLFGMKFRNKLGTAAGLDKNGDYINAYFQNFPGIKDYMERTKVEAREDGFVETLFGRRIYISGFTDGNQARRNFAERQAINAPIQGSAADIIKRAMIQIPEALSQTGSSARMLLQVHDELIFEVPEAEVKAATAVIVHMMETAADPVLNLTVPIVVDTGIADSWADAH